MGFVKFRLLILLSVCSNNGCLDFISFMIDSMNERVRGFTIFFDILTSNRHLKETALTLKISEEDFDTEFQKNGCNKNWLKNLSKKTNKKWSAFAKKEIVIETVNKQRDIMTNCLMTIE